MAKTRKRRTRKGTRKRRGGAAAAGQGAAAEDGAVAGAAALGKGAAEQNDTTEKTSSQFRASIIRMLSDRLLALETDPDITQLLMSEFVRVDGDLKFLMKEIVEIHEKGYKAHLALENIEVSLKRLEEKLGMKSAAGNVSRKQFVDLEVINESITSSLTEFFGSKTKDNGLDQNVKTVSVSARNGLLTGALEKVNKIRKYMIETLNMVKKDLIKGLDKTHEALNNLTQTIIGDVRYQKVITRMGPNGVLTIGIDRQNNTLGQDPEGREIRKNLMKALRDGEEIIKQSKKRGFRNYNLVPAVYTNKRNPNLEENHKNKKQKSVESEVSNSGESNVSNTEQYHSGPYHPFKTFRNPPPLTRRKIKSNHLPPINEIVK